MIDQDRLQMAALAVCQSMHGNPLYLSEYYIKHARAAISAYLGDTHVDVPREPTEKMLESGEDTFFSTYTGTPTSTPEDVWKAMLSAELTERDKG